jgi:chloramphenicol 3-O-phosphotransferase
MGERSLEKGCEDMAENEERQIYLVTGVMAAGKSTVSQMLAARLKRCVHLRGDVFRRMIVSGREEMSQTPLEEAVRQLHLRYRMAAAAAKQYLEGGFSVVMQDNYYGEDLKRMLEYLEGYPVRVVVLCPDVETVKKRELGRGKTGYTGFSVKALYDDFIRTTPRIGYWLDTSEQTAEQTVRTILSHFA